MQYVQPVGAQGPDNAFGKDYVDKNAGAGIAGSFIAADVPEHLQIEILHAIAGAGLTPSGADLRQLQKAIRSQRLNFAAADAVSGTANAITLAFSPAFASLSDLVGVPLRFVAEATTTDLVSLNVDGLGLTPVLLAPGVQARDGDIASGDLIEVVYDGSNFILSRGQSIFINTALTFTVGSGGDFATPHSAFEWLSRKIITSTGSVTLSVLAGASSFSSSLVIDHPQAHRINLDGAPLTGAVPVAADFPVTGHSSGARATDRAAHHTFLAGRFATRWTFTAPAQMIIKDCRLGRMRDIYLIAAGSGGAVLDVERGGIDNVEGAIAAYGSASSNISLDGGSTLRGGGTLISSGAGAHAISGSASNLSLGSIIARSSGGHGAQSDRSSFSVATLDTRGNASRGALAQHGGTIVATTIVTSTNGAGGAFADNGGSIRFETSIRCQSNGSPGLHATNGGRISGPGTGSDITANGTIGMQADGGRIEMPGTASIGGGHTTDAQADDGAFIDLTGIVGGLALSPAANTIGNANSYIKR